MTTNVQAVGGEMIDDSSEEDYMHKFIFKQEPENVATLSEKNVKKIKDVRKKLKQNKNKEEMENKNKKKLKNMEVTHQRITKNVKAVGGEIIDDSSEEDDMHKSIFEQEPENFATLSEKNVKKIKDVRKKLKQNKNKEEMENKNKKKLKNMEVTHQRITKNVKAVGGEIIDDSSEEDDIHKSIFEQESENFATLSEKNVKKIKDVRKKLKQNKNKEEMENKNKKKLKNMEVTHQRITKNVKAVGGEIIDDSSEEDDMHKSIFEQEPENFATLSEKDVKKIKDVRKKLKQNKNKDEMKKKSNKKLKNIEGTQQQITTNVKAAGLEMIDDSSKEDYMHKSIYVPLSFGKIDDLIDAFSKDESYIPQAIFIPLKPKNVATLSEKNIKEIKDVRKKLKQNKNKDEMEKKSNKKLKNIEGTQQQITTNVKAAGLEMIDDSSKEDYMHKSISVPLSFEKIDDMIDFSKCEDYIPQAIFIPPKPKNVATLSEKNIEEIKDVQKKLKQHKNKDEMEKKSNKKLKNIEGTQQQITTNVKAAGLEMIDDSSKEDYMHKSISVPLSFGKIDDMIDFSKCEDYIPQAIFIPPKPKNVATLSEKNIKEIKDVRKKLQQNKNKDEMEKKSNKKLKNIEGTQQQITTNVKAAGLEMIDDSSKEDYMHKSISVPLSFGKIDDMIDFSKCEDYIPQAIFIPPKPKNVATLSEKNIEEIEDVQKKLKQHKNKDEMEKKSNKKLKNIEGTQQQITTNVKAAGLEMIDDSSKEDYMHKSISVPLSFEKIDDMIDFSKCEDYIPQAIFIPPKPKNVATLSEKNIEEIEDVQKKLKQHKNKDEIEKKSNKKLKNIEGTQQQITTNVKAAGLEMIDDSSKEDYMHKSISVPLSFEKIDDMIDFSKCEDYIPQAIFIPPKPKNVATLSEKNIEEIKDVQKKLKQHKNKDEMEKKSNKKLKNIEGTQQQITTNVKAAGLEMIDDSSKEDYMHKSISVPLSFEKMDDMIDFSKCEDYIPQAIFIPPKPKNVATLSEKNIEEIKDVQKKLKQHKNKDEMEKKSNKKLKNIEGTQQQITTNVKAAGLEMIDDSSKEDYMHKSISVPLSFEKIDDLIDAFRKDVDYIPQAIFIPPKPKNVATLSEKNIKEIKNVSEKFEQSAEQVDKYSLTELLTNSEEEKMNKMLNNETKAMKLLEDIETNDESIIIRKQIPGEDKLTDAKTENKRDDTNFIKKLIFLLSLCPNTTEDQKIIKNITDKAYQLPDDYHSLEYAYKKFIDACTSQQRDKNQLGVSDANTHIPNRIKRTYCNLAEDILKLKYEINDHVNNICQTTVNNKSKEHGYTLNETVEEDQVIKVVEENKINEVENTNPDTTSNETLLCGKDVILENNGKMTNQTLMVEDISNVAYKIDKQIDVRKNWWPIYIENMFSQLLFLFLLLLLFLLFCNCG